MSKSQRQLVVLGVLLVVLAGTLVLWSKDATPGAAAPASTRTPALSGGAARATVVSDLHLDLLSVKSEELRQVTRNPFRFQPRPAPAPRVAAVVARPEPVVPAGPVAPVGPPPPPPIPLKFIGVIDAPARIGRMAILSDSRGGVFYGKEGDTIEGRYRVLKISNETAELAYIDGRGRQTIRLSGQ